MADPTPSTTTNLCSVDLPVPDDCCVSPCDPPWRKDRDCLIWYEERFFRFSLGPEGGTNQPAGAVLREYVEFRITYEHRLCLLGKQHGALLYTVTLLPGEKVTLYHYDRYRRTTSEVDRFSVATTFMQFTSAIHQSRVTNTLESLSDRLISTKTNTAVSVGGGLAGFLGAPSGGTSTSVSVTDHRQTQVGFVSDQFNQS